MQARFDLVFNRDDHHMSKAELIDAMRACDALCPCVTDIIDAEVMAAPGRRVKVISNFGVGYDHIDIAAAGREGVAVTNTPDVLTDSTADIAMTLMLMVARRAGEGERMVRANGWKGWYPTQLMGASITGKTLGIVGMGRIGQAMAAKAHFGFGMKILYSNRKPVAAERLGALAAEYCEDIDELMARSDFVALHCPGGQSTRKLVDAGKLAAMKPTAFLINTSRGDVLDTDALIAALQNGVIAGAGLDVYVGEPNVPEALKPMENVVLLPHLGSATVEARTAMGLKVVDNLSAWFDGMTPPDRVA